MLRGWGILARNSMKKLLAALLTACVILSCFALFCSAEEDDVMTTGAMEDMVLKYVVTFEDGGSHNFTAFCDPNYEVQEGDYLVYDVLLDQEAIDAYMGSIDMNYMPSNKNARDAQILDSEGIDIHPKNKLSNAVPGEWYTRTVPLTSLAGSTLAHIMLPCHPRYDETVPGGTYTAYYDNIYILDADDEIVCTIFENELDESVVNTNHTASKISATLTLVDWTDTLSPDELAVYEFTEQCHELAGLSITKDNAKANADAITAARAAYEALSDAAKALVDSSALQALASAEQALAQANETTAVSDETELAGNSETDSAGSKETDAPTTGDTPKDEKKSGCGSVITAPVIALLAAIGLAAPAVLRKKG